MVWLNVKKADLAEMIVLPENLIMTQQALSFTPEEMQIRQADEPDADALALLVAELGYPTEASQARERLIDIKRAGDSVLVAAHNSKVIGMAVLHRTRFLHRPPDARISTLVVFEKYRNFGIGTRLVEAAEAVFHEWGCERVEVTSGAKREAAHRFYNREGYIEQPKRFVKPLSRLAS